MSTKFQSLGEEQRSSPCNNKHLTVVTPGKVIGRLDA